MTFEMKPLICERCGGQISRKTMRCEYCGTEYGYENGAAQIRFTVDRPGVQKIVCQTAVDKDLILRSPEGAREYALREMREQIADGLLAFMKITVAEDFRFSRNAQIICGEIKVLDPTFSGY